MKEKLLIQPQKRVIDDPHNTWWTIFYMIPSLVLGLLLGVVESYVHHPIIWIAAIIILYLIWLSWFIYILLSAFTNKIHEKIKSKAALAQLTPYKTMSIIACIALDAVLPVMLVGILNWTMIGVILLIELWLTIVIYQKTWQQLKKGDFDE